MRKLMMILFIVSIAAVNMNAQNEKQPPPKKTPEERADNMSKRMAKELALTADQQAKVKDVILKRERDREDGEAKRKAEMDKVDAEFKTILTPDQYQKFEQKKEEMKQKRAQKRMAPAPPANDNPPPAPPVQK